MTRILDVSLLPSDVKLQLHETEDLNMRVYISTWRPVLAALAANRVISVNDSFGFAMLPPWWDSELHGDDEWLVNDWDDPYKFTWFAGGWGPDRDRYIANAVRKLRPLLRINDEVSTLSMVLGESPTEFEDEVASVNDAGEFEWGDFPWGGAAVVRYGELELVGACSAFSQHEDHMVTELILGDFANRLLKARVLANA